MTLAARGRVPRQAGVAIAIVVWFIAAMSLLVAGIVSQARTDTRLAQLHVAKAKSTAAADGAINLLMADLLENGFSPDDQQLIQAQYRLGEMLVSVLAVPSPMLVDVNNASQNILQQTITVAGAARPADTQRLAEAIVQWRSAPRAAGSAVTRFKTLEDVVQVDGLTRSAWDRLRDYTMVAGSRGGVSGTSAELALAALVEFSPATRAGRENLLSRSPQGSLPMRNQSGDFRVDAMLRYGDRVWLRRRWVSSGGGRSGFPWRFLRTEPVRIVPLAKGGAVG